MTPPPRLSLDDRRLQIIEAVTPAVLEHGAAVTSKQLAEAAGIAEGTIFRSFGDKDSLLIALAEHHLDDLGMAEEILDVSDAANLEQLVSGLVPVLVARMRFVFRLMMALGPLGHRLGRDRRQEFDDSKQRLAERFEPFVDELRITPLVAADLVRTLAWSASSGWGDATPSLTEDDVVNVLLHGMASAPAPAATASAA